MIPQVFYRYTYEYGGLVLNTFDFIRETPQGYWIKSSETWKSPPERWIPKVSRKRYAYPTKKEALNSYIIRSRRRVSILIDQTDYTSEGIKKAEKLIKTM